VEYEWAHLMAKLQARNSALFRTWRKISVPEVHPLFEVCAGDIAPWEK